MADLFADENFPLPAVRHLRTLRHDVLTAAEAGMINRRIPDSVIIEYATRLDRAVLTLNWGDFLDLHHVADAHAGIIVCEADTDYSSLARRIDVAIAAYRSLARQFIEVANP